jgi:hypothetical protein
MRVILCEFVDEAERLIQQHGLDFFLSKDVRVVCLHPKVLAYFKKKGISAQGTHFFLSNEAQHRIILKSEHLTTQLVKELKLKDQWGITKGYEETSIHHLRLYLNHFLWILEILHGVRSVYKVDEMYFGVPQNKERMYTKKGYIQPSERFLGLLAKEFCKVHRIPFVDTPSVFPQSPWHERISSKLVHALGMVVAGLEYIWILLSRSKNDEVIVVPGISYRMDLLLNDIRKQNTRVKAFMVWEGHDSLRNEVYKIYATLTNTKKKFKQESVLESMIHLDLLKGWWRPNAEADTKFIERFRHVQGIIETALKKDCVYEGVSISECLTQKIKNGLQFEMLRLRHSTDVLYRIFKQLNPKLLMSMYSSGIYYTMGDLANVLGFKALNISHGTHVPPNNQFERIENYRLATSVISNSYPYVAVQTPWTGKFLDYYQDRRQRLLTGPLLYSVTSPQHRDSLRKEILGDHQDRKIIIHAATQKGRHGMRFHITETLDEYLATLADIVHAVNALPDTHFVIRPHPICDLTEEEFRLLLPACDRMSILSKGPFSKVLSASDLLVSYSSTCIEEAVQNGIPVVLYDQWQRYNHFNLSETTECGNLKMQPAYYVTQKNILTETLAAALKLFENKSLEHQALLDYKYPSHFKDNFYRFIRQALESRAVA